MRRRISPRRPAVWVGQRGDGGKFAVHCNAVVELETRQSHCIIGFHEVHIRTSSCSPLAERDRKSAEPCGQVMCGVWFASAGRALATPHAPPRGGGGGGAAGRGQPSGATGCPETHSSLGGGRPSLRLTVPLRAARSTKKAGPRDADSKTCLLRMGSNPCDAIAVSVESESVPLDFSNVVRTEAGASDALVTILQQTRRASVVQIPCSSCEDVGMSKTSGCDCRQRWRYPRVATMLFSLARLRLNMGPSASDTSIQTKTMLFGAQTALREGGRRGAGAAFGARGTAAASPARAAMKAGKTRERPVARPFGRPLAPTSARDKHVGQVWTQGLQMERGRD